MFNNLHIHSHYSVLDSTGKVPDIASRIAELGQTAFALTEHGTISSWFDGYKNAKAKKLKYIFGIEAYFTPDVTIKDRNKSYHMCLYAMNDEGMFNLKQLVIMSNALGFYYDPRIDLDMLKQYSGGIIATSACMGGILKSEYPLGYAETFKNLFGGNFYIAIHTNQTPIQGKFNKKAIEISKLCGIGLIAEVDSHYVNKSDAGTHRNWVKLKGESYYTTDDYYLMSEAEVRKSLDYLPNDIVEEAINNTQVVVDKCNVEIDYNQKNFPIFPVEDKLSYLKNITNKGWEDKIEHIIPKTMHDLYKNRIDYEYEVLEKCDYLNYVCIAYDIINYCRNHNIRVSPGRGSSAGSLVAYLLGITGIDPIKYNLAFERFCNPFRVSMPDIDMDFPQRSRQQVIEYIKSKYGNVFQVRTFNAMKDKGALQRAGQSLSILPNVINEMSKKITKLDDVSPEVANTEVIQLATKFKGVIQNFGVHASAIVVLPKHPAYFTGVEKQGETFVVCHNFHDLEEIGILKQDILGLKTLDVIDDCINSLDDYLDLNTIPTDDAKTFDMLCAGNTSGVFQIEGSGMTNLVKDLQPRRYEDLIPLVALYRPGVLNAGMVDVFVNRRTGKEPVTYLHPILEPILKDTYGVVLYQEQIMECVRAISGFTLGEADMLRRAIGRKEKGTMDSREEDFLKRATIPQAKEVWEQIKTFAAYGFNKSHSAAYGMVAYQTAYLKAHYPLNYLCALLNSELGDQEKTSEYVDQVIQEGIKILPPHINYSKNEWIIENSGLRVGFSCIKGMGKITINEPFSNFEEFIEMNNHLSRNRLESMAYLNMFDENQAYAIEYITWWKDNCKKIIEAKEKILHYASNSKKVNEWTNKLSHIEKIKPQKLSNKNICHDADSEFYLLGFSLVDVFSSYDMRMHNGQNILGCLVLMQKVITDKKGRLMSFVHVKTKNNIKLELVMFSNVHINLLQNNVYLFKTKGNQILEVMNAKRLVKSNSVI